MDLKRGLTRLAIAAVTMWFIFWTVAYVMHPYSSLTPEPATFLIRLMAWKVIAPCTVAIVLFGTWIGLGLRARMGPPMMRG
ncbi:MAG TPA: hypothetical protein VKQ73_16950 [Stellaceae bacterium]|nr:hypothetical protein [Stellaceae bacterium]